MIIEGGKTAIARKGPSAPTRELASRGVLKGRILDYGCGKGADAEWLGCEKYDPVHHPVAPEGLYDTIICNYVLNVLPPEGRADVLMRILSLLDKGGTAYVTVRRDIAKETVGRGCLQFPVVLPSFYSFMHKRGAYETYRIIKGA